MKCYIKCKTERLEIWMGSSCTLKTKVHQVEIRVGIGQGNPDPDRSQISLLGQSRGENRSTGLVPSKNWNKKNLPASIPGGATALTGQDCHLPTRFPPNWMVTRIKSTDPTSTDPETYLVDLTCIRSHLPHSIRAGKVKGGGWRPLTAKSDNPTRISQYWTIWLARTWSMLKLNPRSGSLPWSGQHLLIQSWISQSQSDLRSGWAHHANHVKIR